MVEGLTASKTTAVTITRTIIRHAALRPALRWYSAAVVNSSAAEDVSTATEDTLVSILSEYGEERRSIHGLGLIQGKAHLTFRPVDGQGYPNRGIFLQVHGSQSRFPEFLLHVLGSETLGMQVHAAKAGFGGSVLGVVEANERVHCLVWNRRCSFSNM